MPLSLTCPSGHRWQLADSESSSSDMKVACPVCSLIVSVSDSLETVSCPTSVEPATANPSARLESTHSKHDRDYFPGFDILNELGRGGMGIVYRAFDRARKEIVALKTIKGLDTTAVYHLKQEFRTLADITHPNLVTLHELISDGHEWFLTMELVDGSDFITYVRSAADKFGCLREALRQLVEGVSALIDADPAGVNALAGPDRVAVLSGKTYPVGSAGVGELAKTAREPAPARASPSSLDFSMAQGSNPRSHSIFRSQAAITFVFWFCLGGNSGRMQAERSYHFDKGFPEFDGSLWKQKKVRKT